MLNGNIGVMRTMISEIIREKKYQSRAFLLLPMTFNIGVIIGPLLGGLLADPVGTYPGIFGPHGTLGGKRRYLVDDELAICASECDQCHFLDGQRAGVGIRARGDSGGLERSARLWSSISSMGGQSSLSNKTKGGTTYRLQIRRAAMEIKMLK